MEQKIVLDMVFGLIGGLSIFLLGMKNMSEGMQAIAGAKLRSLISAVTDNRLAACGTGAAVTSLIQSSSVTTVMVVGMVNAGVMTLQQAIGVILGADIGTTITAWIVSLNVLEYGLITLGISGFVYLFTKNERVRYGAMMVMGVGMVFFGLQLMKHGLEPLRSNEAFIALFSRFEPKGYYGVLKCILVGSLVTAAVQSSSATVAITITLARTGVIGYDTAVALVLGENIGTTITAFLASLGTSTNAKRVAYAHIFIKVVGVSLMTPLFFVYLDFLKALVSEDVDIAKRIALAHSLFNIFIVVLFLPLVSFLAVLLRWLAKDKPYKEPPRLTNLDVRMLSTPTLVIEESRNEVLHMGNNVKRMMECLREVLESSKDIGETDPLVKKIFHREQVLDTVQHEISGFLTDVLANDVPHSVIEEGRQQLRMADEYESVSDYVTNILKHYLRLRKAEVPLPADALSDLLGLHDMVTDYVDLVHSANVNRDRQIIGKAYPQGGAITHHYRDLRSRHLARLSEKKLDPMLSLVYFDMLNAYRRVKDHILNIAEALAGEK